MWEQTPERRLLTHPPEEKATTNEGIPWGLLLLDEMWSLLLLDEMWIQEEIIETIMLGMKIREWVYGSIPGTRAKAETLQLRRGICMTPTTLRS